MAFPEGRLGAYLESLDRLSVVCDAAEVARLLPGHGPVLDHPAEVLEAYKQHRQERLPDAPCLPGAWCGAACTPFVQSLLCWEFRSKDCLRYGTLHMIQCLASVCRHARQRWKAWSATPH